MQLLDVEKNVRAAKQDGHRFLLVCYDIWDRNAGDADQGYYYPVFATAAEVRKFLAKVQLVEETAPGSPDVCEAVIDLSRMTERFEASLCENPSDWLARLARLH